MSQLRPSPPQPFYWGGGGGGGGGRWALGWEVNKPNGVGVNKPGEGVKLFIPSPSQAVLPPPPPKLKGQGKLEGGGGVNGGRGYGG